MFSFFSFSRGQSSIEYVFILSLVLGFVIALMISGMREGELGLAAGAARAAALSWAAENSSFYLASLETRQAGRSFGLTPALYYWSGGSAGSGGSGGSGRGGRLSSLPSALKRRMINAVQQSVAPLSPPPPPSTYCFSSVNYDYCVVDPS